MMDILITILLVLTGILSLICYVSVLYQMWTENMILGICCLVGTFCTGLGSLVLFIWGWLQPDLRANMITWTFAQIVFTALIFLRGGF